MEIKLNTNTKRATPEEATEDVCRFIGVLVQEEYINSDNLMEIACYAYSHAKRLRKEKSCGK